MEDKLLIKQAKKSIFELIIGIKIAIKLKGIIKSRSKFSGILFPNKIPVKLEICQVKNRVIPEPNR